MDFRKKIILHVDEAVGGAVGADKLLEGWEGHASVLADRSGELRTAIHFHRDTDLGARDNIRMALHPQNGTASWTWYVTHFRCGELVTEREGEGEASSLAEAIASIDAALAEIMEGVPA
jgi:hypothetical protein